jgi:glycosyltransferase involved in cell wall biosynthesis
MKVLFVHDRFGSLAGAEANLFHTANAFKEKGHSVAIAHGPSTGKGESEWGRLFQLRASLRNDGDEQELNQLFATFLPDVIYVHKMSELQVLERLLETGVPLVRMVHDHDIYCMRSYKYFYFSRKICTRPAGLHCIFPCGAFIGKSSSGKFPLTYVSLRRKQQEIALNKRFHRHVVVSEYMRQELLRNGFRKERIEIHPPVPRMGDAQIRSNFSDRNLLIFAGQIIRGKGVDVLLEALALVRTRFECVILGDGSHRRHCERKAAKLKLQDRVHFKGFVPQEQLKEFYRECSGLLISSIWPEPFATIGVEALRYGIPVLAFDAGGISDWLTDGENGYLVPWRDVETYARRIEQLLADKANARRMGEAGLQMVNRRYNFTQYIQELENLFRKVIAEGGRVPEVSSSRVGAFP